MAKQRVVSPRFPYLPVHIQVRRPGADIEADEEALLDTGFTGEVIIPRRLITNGARPSAEMKVRLGDESVVMAPVYLASVTLGSFAPIPVSALALGNEVILGVGVMDHFTITLDHAARIIVEA